jgi:hypothetical protein
MNKPHHMGVLLHNLLRLTAVSKLCQAVQTPSKNHQQQPKKNNSMCGALFHTQLQSPT